MRRTVLNTYLRPAGLSQWTKSQTSHELPRRAFACWGYSLRSRLWGRAMRHSSKNIALIGALMLLTINPAMAALSVSVSPNPATLPAAGAQVTITVDVTSTDNETNVTVASPIFGQQLCLVQSLSAGITATCTGVYFVTEQDVTRGSIQSTITATSDNDTTGATGVLALSNQANQGGSSSGSSSGSGDSGNPDFTVSITGSASAQVGDVLSLQYTLKNTGTGDLSNIRIVSTDSNATVCESSLLSAGYELICSASHLISQADVQGNSYSESANASADGLSSTLSASSTLSLSGAANNNNSGSSGTGSSSSGSSSSGSSSSSSSGSGVGGAIPLLGFARVSDDKWDVTAVSKVIQIFAWGGHARAAQIQTWADMSPDTAIAEMLNFDQHNWRLSPRSNDEVDDLYQVSNTLGGLSNFWSSSSDANKMPWNQRPYYAKDGSVHMLWAAAGLVRGLNPFHHKIGMWETNYHMAVNLDSQVNGHQIIQYYDDIMQGHKSDRPYKDVINTAALSAAVATQYMHRRNRWKDGECLCNEDFAREYFQLFFGILGTGDSEYHETVTIKNMARALTDVQVPWDNSVYRLPEFASFGTENHYQGPLQILRHTINGVNAQQRVSQLSDIAINHWESKRILPETIIRDLADDNLDNVKLSQIRAAWQSMLDGNYRFLDFIRAYAVSTMFHNPTRVKHWNSFDRNMIIANRLLHSNQEVYLNIYQPTWMFTREGVQAFRPLHNVFGNQNSQEAMENPFYFLKNFDRSTRDVWNYLETGGWKYGQYWEKDWSRIIPRSANGQWLVKDVASWLWNFVTIDGLKNYSALERAHLHALLATDRDLMQLHNSSKLNAVFNKYDVVNNKTIAQLVSTLGNRSLDLDSSTDSVRARANKKIGRAFAFIAATPYIFAQTGD